MSQITITIDDNASAVLRAALLDMLGDETQRLDHVLVRADRERHSSSARDAFRRLLRLGSLLEVVGWDETMGQKQLRIDADRQLPLALAALRSYLAYAQEIANDSHVHGDADEVARATARVHETTEALRALEAHGDAEREHAGRDDA